MASESSILMIDVCVAQVAEVMATVEVGLAMVEAGLGMVAQVTVVAGLARVVRVKVEVDSM